MSKRARYSSIVHRQSSFFGVAAAGTRFRLWYRKSVIIISLGPVQFGFGSCSGKACKKHFFLSVTWRIEGGIQPFTTLEPCPKNFILGYTSPLIRSNLRSCALRGNRANYNRNATLIMVQRSHDRNQRVTELIVIASWINFYRIIVLYTVVSYMKLFGNLKWKLRWLIRIKTDFVSAAAWPLFLPRLK